MIVRFTPAFKRSYKKLIATNPALSNRFDEKLRIFATDPHDASLKTHKLDGSLKHLWSFSIDGRIRILFQFIEDGSALLSAVGTHDEIY